MAKKACWFLFPLVFLASCKKTIFTALVEFYGDPPSSTIYEDQRKVILRCPGCKTVLKPFQKSCPGCGKEIIMPYPLEDRFCGGKGICPICEGRKVCNFCKGSGKLQDRDCFSCQGRKVCSLCKGSGRCDTCKGEGFFKSLPEASSPLVKQAFYAQKPQKILQSAYLVKVNTKVSFSAGSLQKWRVSSLTRGKRITILEDYTEKFVFTPTKAGLYVISVKDPDFEEAFLEAIELSPPIIKRKNSEGVYEKAGNVGSEKGVVGSHEELRYILESSPKVKGKYINWYIGKRKIGSGNPFSISSGDPGRFKISAAVLEGFPCVSEAVSQTVVGELVVSCFRKTRKGKLALQNGNVAGLGERISFECKYKPADLPPDKFRWEISSEGKKLAEGKGTKGSYLINASGRVKLTFGFGRVRSKDFHINVIRARFIDINGHELSHLMFSRWENAFDKEERFIKNFYLHDPQAFYIEIKDPSGKPAKRLEIFATDPEGKILGSPISYRLQKKEDKFLAGPCILVADQVDDLFCGESAGSGDDVTIMGILGGRINIIYKDLLCGGIRIGADPRQNRWDAISTAYLNFIVLRHSSGGKTVLENPEGFIQKLLRQANKVFSQAAIRFSKRSLYLVDPPSNTIFISGNASGISPQATEGYLSFILDGKKITLSTHFGDSPELSASRIDKLLPEGICSKMLSILLEGGTTYALTLFYPQGRSFPNLKLEEPYTDTGQYLYIPQLDPHRIHVSLFNDEPSYEEFALLSALKDDDPTTIDVIVVQDIFYYDQKIRAKSYPMDIFNPSIANTILLSRSSVDFPFLFAKHLAHLLLKSIETLRIRYNLIASKDVKKNSIDAPKRLNHAQILKMRRNFGFLAKLRILKSK
jgi:hypothetical protein